MNNPRIYNEIGPGQRVSLTKLAVEKFEQTGRPFRIAIDISIWNFEVQGGKGEFEFLLLRFGAQFLQLKVAPIRHCEPYFIGS